VRLRELWSPKNLPIVGMLQSKVLSLDTTRSYRSIAVAIIPVNLSDMLVARFQCFEYLFQTTNWSPANRPRQMTKGPLDAIDEYAYALPLCFCLSYVSR
jgi:hypothetical protein